MLERELQDARSHGLAVKLFDKWVRERQNRGDFQSGDRVKNLKELEPIARHNFESQVLTPRKGHLDDLKSLGESLEFADKAALLAMIELPTLETSTLLHRLSRQVAADPKAPYFGRENLADNCGCGCGCGCAVMADLGIADRIILHHQAKPHSIDPFNELETPQATRDALLAKDFLASFQALSEGVTERVNRRYFRMAEEFA